MDYDLIRKLTEVFSEENKKLRAEVEDLKKQITRAKGQADDKLLEEVFSKAAPEKLKKAIRAKVEKTECSLPVVEPIVEIPVFTSAPASLCDPVPELPKKGRPKTSTVSRELYQKRYQAEYREKKRAEKLAKLNSQ